MFLVYEFGTQINLDQPESSGVDSGLSGFALCLSSFSFNGSCAASAGDSEEVSEVDAWMGLSCAQGFEAVLLLSSYSRMTECYKNGLIILNTV